MLYEYDGLQYSTGIGKKSSVESEERQCLHDDIDKFGAKKKFESPQSQTESINNFLHNCYSEIARRGTFTSTDTSSRKRQCR